MTDRPLWRQTYDAVERSVAPRMEALVRSGEFAHASAWAAWARSAVRDQINAAGARLWHLVNLPAGTDVQRLRAQVGELDREVRRLALALELAQQPTRQLRR